MTAIIYKEFYNKDRGLPEPVWGNKVPDKSPARSYPALCPTCGSTEMYYSASPDDPEEVFVDTVRCKNCGRITDFYEALKQGLHYNAGESLTTYKIIRKEEVLMQAYCVKCRTKQELKDAKAIIMKNGRPATQGFCTVCGTKVFRIGG